MANVTNISVLNSAATTATVSTLDAFRSDIGTSALTVFNNTASLFNATITGTASITGTMTAVLVAGAAQIGSVTAVISGSLPVSMNATTAGGLSLLSTLVTGTTSVAVVKASAGQVYHIAATNNTATIAYLKVYDLTTVTLGTSVTPKWRMMIPGSGSGGAGFVEEITNGLVFSTGISFGVSGGFADNDTSAFVANSIIINIGYK